MHCNCGPCWLCTIIGVHRSLLFICIVYSHFNCNHCSVWHSYLCLLFIVIMMYCWLSFFIKNIVHCCLLHGYVQSGGWGLENPLCSHCFSIFSTIQGKTVARNFWNFCSEALQLMSTIFIVHCYLDHYALSFLYHAWICFSNHEGLKFELPLVWWSLGDFKSSLWRKAFEPLFLWLSVGDFQWQKTFGSGSPGMHQQV